MRPQSVCSLNGDHKRASSSSLAIGSVAEKPKPTQMLNGRNVAKSFMLSRVAESTIFPMIKREKIF